MEKVKLYRDITTGKVFTLEEIKNQYMESIIRENLACIGGNIEIINDDILAWCNEYTDFVEAGKTMTTEEVQTSVKNIYHAIANNVRDLIEATKDNLFDGDELLERLKVMLKEYHGV